MRNKQKAKEITERVGRRASVDANLPSLERLRQSGPFRSQDQFVNSSLLSFTELLRLTELRRDSRVLDYGCGLGRLCIPLQAFLKDEGSYVGVDTDASCISYLDELHDRPNFSFHHVDIFTSMYNRSGHRMSSALDQLEVGDPFDVAFLFSVFTHVLPEDMDPLLAFLKRSLKPGGQVMASFFILNDVSLNGIEQGTSHRPFPYSFGAARIDNEDVPEGAVAYAEDDLADYVERAGLTIAHTSYGGWSGQQSDTWHWQDNLVLTH